MIHPSNQIHPSAIIADQVQLGENNIIEANCVLDGKIQIGNNNHFRVGTILYYQISIGDHNQFFPYVTIGYQGEMGSKGDRLLEDGIVRIGNHNTIREYVNVHSPVRTSSTEIGDHCYIMNKVYLAHDVKLRDHVILTAGTHLAGAVEVHAHANLGLGCVTHQRLCIGESAMVGMQTANTRHVPPFAVVSGVPARLMKFNLFGAKRRGFEEQDLEIINTQYEAIIRGEFQMDHPIVDCIRTFLEKYPDALTQFQHSK